MTRNELINFLQNLPKYKNAKGTKFNYAIRKNEKAIQLEVDDFYDMEKPEEAFINYDKARIEICKKYAEKDEKDQPVIENGNYKILDQENFKEEINKLQEENKEVIENRRKQVDDLNAFLAEESDIKICKVKLSDIPADLTGQDIENIFPMIED